MGEAELLSSDGPSLHVAISYRDRMAAEDPRANHDAADEEARLLEEYRNRRDGRGFDALYRAHRRRVFGVCLRMLREVSKAEDACHDVFVRAFERFDSMRGDDFGAWVAGIARNRCLDQLRRRRRWSTLDSLETEVIAAVESPALARLELEQAAGVVSSLEEHQRVVFLLFHLDRKSYREIEDCTGYSAKQVKSYLQNARRNVGLAWQRLSERGSEPLHPAATEESGHE